MNLIAIIPAAIVIPLAGWKLYRRYRNGAIRQRLNSRKSWLSAVFFPFLFLLLAGISFRDSASFASLLAGGAAGACLGILGLRLTTFEAVDAVLFYRPHSYLGIALLFLLSARITYRFFQVLSHGLPSEPDDITFSPIGLAMIASIIWYYAVYSAGLLYRRSKLRSR